MKVLQFAFDSDAENPYLPHNHETDFVVYTGTHDNNTTVGWFGTLDGKQKDRIWDYLGGPAEEMPWPLVRAALASVCRLAIVPMQDLLALGAESRINTPGVLEGNWRWRLHWDPVKSDLTERLQHLNHVYGRNP
jgi:4-alpha-glucanotransferase